MERATRRRVSAGVAFLLAIIAASSFWYWQFEQLSPVDALYQTVITISTVGFGELVEFSEASRLVTIAVILLGAGTTAYTLTALFEHFADDRIAAAWRRTWNALRGRCRAISSCAAPAGRAHELPGSCGEGRCGRGRRRSRAHRGGRSQGPYRDPG